MRHLSPLELRVLCAVRENPCCGVDRLAHVVGETVGAARSALGVLRRGGLVERQGVGLVGYGRFEITPLGEADLREWSLRYACEQLPPGVIPIRRAQLARARRIARHG